MTNWSWGIAAAITVLGAPAALADSLPLPLEPAPVAVQPAADPGFAADVERGLADFTRLQCSLLGLVLINSQPCPVR